MFGESYGTKILSILEPLKTALKLLGKWVLIIFGWIATYVPPQL